MPSSKSSAVTQPNPSDSFVLPCHFLSTNGAGSTNHKKSKASTGAQEGLSAGPVLLHKVKNQRSILSLVASDGKIFAGTQGGEILVWSLTTYELLDRIVAHHGAVLGLYMSADNDLLFSCAGDAIVNAWSTRDFHRVYSIYSTFDVGDVFCIVYSSALEAIFLGAQNTSIQWYDFSRKDNLPRPNLSSHPSHRTHRFFDSKGPGGISTPRSETLEPDFHGGEVLEINPSHIIQYAHYGYVYCMLLVQGLFGADETLISGGGDGTVKLWQLSKSRSDVQVRELAVLESGDDSVLSMARKDTLLYTGRLEGDVNVWDLDTRQLIRTIRASRVDILSLSVGSGFLFTGSANGQAKIFERYKCKAEWKAHDELILASVFTSIGSNQFLVTGGNDDSVAIWDLTGFLDRQSTPLRPSNEQLVQSLTRFVAFPTVSSKTEHAEDCRQGASWLKNLFKKIGAQTELLKTEDACNPVVLAYFRGRSPKGKKILFYGHYDVFSAENQQLKWSSDPFSLQGRDGFLYGRGVSDNKGPILSAAYAVADLVADKSLENDVIFLIEGEEECGSRGFEQAVRRYKHLIGDVTWILLANSYWLSNDFPCLTYGLRGVVHAKITIEGGPKDLHSGVAGSNLRNEPLKDLVALLTTLTGPNNLIRIPNFYDYVLPLSTEEEQWYAAISKTLSLTTSTSHNPESLKARWREPSFTVHGFTTSSSVISTIIPHVASAEISFRLVPNQDAREISRILKSYLHTQFKALNTTNKISIKLDHPVDPWLGDPNNEIYHALEEAIVDVWGLKANKNTSTPNSEISDEDAKPTRPLYIREGGSIPAIRFLEKEFNAPAAQLPVGQASDNAHLENERLRLVNLYHSREIFRRVFGGLGRK